MVMTDATMIERLKQFVESEMRSCSMDIGGITPLYVYRNVGRERCDRRNRNGTDGIMEEWIHDWIKHYDERCV